MIEQSPTIEKLADALGKAQALMTGAVRDRKNPHFKSSYATLESAIDAAREPMTKNGLAWVQMPGPLTDGGITVTTQIMHSSGQWMRSSFTMPVVKRDPQAVGSAITYACRYAFMAALGLPPVDDDGEAAMQRGTDKPQQDVARRDFKADADALIAEIEAHDSPTSLAMWEQVNRPRVTELFKPAPAEFARVKAAKDKLLASFQTEQEAA
jgi:hypothetical protein